MDNTIYYADLTPCDDMHNYKEAAFMPEFIKADTPQFDNELPCVAQVATRDGWCIVAKWVNNGSTRIYAMNIGALKEGVGILGGVCDSGDCQFAYGEQKNYEMTISDRDRRVFSGRDVLLDQVEEMERKYPQEEQHRNVYVEEIGWDPDHGCSSSMRIPEVLTVTVLISNRAYLASVFEEYDRREMVIQNLRDNVMQEYHKDGTFPTYALVAFKAEGDAIFRFQHLEADKYGEHLFAYYEFENTVS